jgi:3-oxoadipate enol-lactonase
MDTRWDAAWQAANPEIVELIRARADVGDRDAPARMGARRQLEARMAHDTWTRLPSVTLPVLVAAGRYDAVAPLANAEALASQLGNARLAVFDGGHAFFLQDRAAWPAIEEFLLSDSPA